MNTSQTKCFDLAVLDCGELLTLAASGGRPKRGKALSELGLLKNAAIGISKGKITWIGSQKQYRHSYSARKEMSAESAVVMPGFVDPHTHTVFAGSREAEWLQKLGGRSYSEILKNGGGILSTVEKTSVASKKTLFENASMSLKTMLAHGTTSLEIKSGYGLNLKQELKILKVIQRLNKEMVLDVVPTYLGAHVIPKIYENNRSAYVSEVMTSLKKVKPYATFCDVFCEEGAFTILEAEQISLAAKTAGFQIKLHAGQFSDLGGIKLAARIQAISIDHLDVLKKRDIPKLRASGAIAVLLPGVSHFLDLNKHAPARDLIEGDIPVALASDFNPGSSPCLSMQEIIHLAVLHLKMTPAEAIAAATINAAHALGLGQQVGSLEIGKQADLLILDLSHFEQLPYFYGRNHVTTVLKNGNVFDGQGIS